MVRAGAAAAGGLRGGGRRRDRHAGHAGLARGEDVVISTGDKDMAQLVDGHVTLLNTMSGTTLDREGVEQKFGVPPERIIDYLALVGDTSDNIPGVPKVGPKTAAKWLEEYGTLDELVAHADEIKGKVGESLRENLDNLPSPGSWPPSAATWTWTGFGRSAPRQTRQRGAARALPAIRVHGLAGRTGGERDGRRAVGRAGGVLSRGADRGRFRRAAGDAPGGPCSPSTETNSLDYMLADIVGLSFAVRRARASTCRWPTTTWSARSARRDRILERFKPLLEDPDAQAGT